MTETAQMIEIVTASNLVADQAEAQLMCDLGVVALDRMTSDDAWLVSVRGRQQIVPFEALAGNG